LGFKSIIGLFLILSFLSCAQNESYRIDFAMGTVCSVSLFEYGHDSVYNDVFSRIHQIENLMSLNIPSSDVSRINAASGIEAVIVHEDTFKVIERAIYFAQLSNGAFDPTVGPLVSLWGIGSENQRIPTHEEIEKVLPLVNWRNVDLNAQIKSVFLTQRGMALDLGAIAKGYAADEAARIIKDAGIKRALIDLGGNIIVIGQKKDKRKWRVGIQNPSEIRGSIAGVLQVYESTVVTSGVYERFFDENGKRYHHIFDPSLGYPVDNGLLSATVITNISMDADALSTVIFVLGYEEGIAIINALPETEAVFVFDDKSVIKTSGVDFTVTDKIFHMEATK